MNPEGTSANPEEEANIANQDFQSDIVTDLDYVSDTSGPSEDSLIIYDSPQGLLRSWTSGRSSFRYNRHGTLADLLSPDDLQVFVSEAIRREQDRPLASTLIQCPPPDYFPDCRGPVCLLQSCPVNRSTPDRQLRAIQQGEWVLALDELQDYRGFKDLHPLAKSGYVHLYCAERALPFIRLCGVADY